MSQEKKENYGKIFFSWKFPEYMKHERTLGWHLGAFLLGGGLLFYAVFTSSFIFSFIIIITAMIIFLSSTRNPEEIEFVITENGLILQDKFFPYKDIDKFWIIYQPPQIKRLYFIFKGWRPSLSIAMEKENPVKIRRVLLRYLEEDLEKENEPVSESFARWLKI